MLFCILTYQIFIGFIVFSVIIVYLSGMASVLLFSLPPELLVYVLDFVIDSDCQRFPYYLFMIHASLRHFLTRYVFRSVYLTKISQSRLYVTPLNSYVMNIINSKASYAHWGDSEIRQVCNLIKRKMHPGVFSFYLKLSVKALMDVNVQYFENDKA